MSNKENSKELPEMMTTAEAAVYLGVTPGRIRHMIRDERLEAEKRGRDWLITRESVLAVEDRKPGRPKENEGN